MGVRGRQTAWPVVCEVLRAVAGGATHAQAAERTGMSERSVRNFLDEHGYWVARNRTPRDGALSIDDREEIFVGIQRGESNAHLGERLGFHRSTIYREIRAGGGRGAYRPFRCHALSEERARRPRPSRVHTRPWLWEEVMALLRTRKWSPEQIAWWEDRAVPGHWEGDLIIGANGLSAVATLVERSTRFGMLVKLEGKTAPHVADQLAANVARLPAELFRSLTWDQGSELA